MDSLSVFQGSARYEPWLAAADNGEATLLKLALIDDANWGDKATTAVPISPDIKAYSTKSCALVSCQILTFQTRLMRRFISRLPGTMRPLLPTRV